MVANIKKPAANTNAKPQATGFLNLYAPGKTGRRKLGVIFLFDGDANQKSLIDWLEKDPANVDKLNSVVQFEYNPNTPDEDKGFVLPE